MDNEGYEMAVLSKAAYDFYYENIEVANKELQAYGFGDYKIDEEHSDEDSVTIVKPDGSVIISYRGTDFSNPRDLLADVQILMGVHSNPLMEPLHAWNRFNDANLKYHLVKEKHGEPMLTGHSLGGAQALHVARKNNAKSIVFNPGSSPFAEPFHYYLTNDKAQTIYTTGDDIISYSSYLFDKNDNLIVVPRKDTDLYYSHQLINFLPSRKLDKEVPMWMNPINIETREMVSVCELYPELCYQRHVIRQVGRRTTS